MSMDTALMALQPAAPRSSKNGRTSSRLRPLPTHNTRRVTASVITVASFCTGCSENSSITSRVTPRKSTGPTARCKYPLSRSRTASHPNR